MIVDNGKYYLYRHIRLDKNEPFYIGVGTKSKRVLTTEGKVSYTRAFEKYRRNKIWASIYNKTEMAVEIVLETNDIEFIEQKEKEFIALYGRIITKDGILANMATGGYFTNNFHKPYNNTDKQKERLRKFIEASKGRKGNYLFHSGAKKVFAYSLEGDFLYGFDSVVQARDYLNVYADMKITVHGINKSISAKKNHQNYIFLADFMGDRISADNIKIEHEPKGIERQLAVIDKNGNILEIFKNMISLCKNKNISKHSVWESIKQTRPSKGMWFKYISYGDN